MIKKEIKLPKGYLTTIPSVIFNRDLDDGSKVLFTVIYSYCSLHGGCTVNNERLQELTSASKSVIGRRLTQLEKANFITRKIHRDIRNQVEGRSIFVCLTQEEFNDTKKSINKDALKAFKENIRKTPQSDNEILGSDLVTKTFTSSEHKALKALFDKWKTKGTDHIIKPINQEQKDVAWNALYLYRLIREDKEKYFNHLLPTLEPKWMKRNNITLANFLNSKLTFKEAVEGHLGLLSDVPVYEDHSKVSHSISDFLGNYRTNKNHQPIGRSWYLFWSCKEGSDALKAEAKKELPIQRKHTEKHQSIYTMIDKLFGVSRKKLEKTTVDLQNQCIRLADALIDEIIIKKLTLKEKRKTDKTIPKLPSYQINSLVNDFASYAPTTQVYLKEHYLPRTFMPTKRSWNTFIEYLANKHGNNHEAKLFNVYKHEVIEYQG